MIQIVEAHQPPLFELPVVSHYGIANMSPNELSALAARLDATVRPERDAREAVQSADASKALKPGSLAVSAEVPRPLGLFLEEMNGLWAMEPETAKRICRTMVASELWPDRAVIADALSPHLAFDQDEGAALFAELLADENPEVRGIAASRISQEAEKGRMDVWDFESIIYCLAEIATMRPISPEGHIIR